MALPSLKRKVTIARPKRGRHGVFSELGDDGLDELKPSLFSEASTWSHTSWTSALSSQPRSMGPFDPEETAEMELAPKGWARKIRPIDHRTNDVKRLRSDEEELAEAKRALRGVKPGDWQGHAFAHYRKKLKDEGRWLALPGLVDLVRKTSEEALKAGSYCLPNNKTAQVRLSQKPTVQWVSMESCVEPEPCSGLAPPPLVVSHKTPLEAAGALGQHFKGHPVIVTFEAAEFERSDEKKGQIVEGEARGVAQHEMFVCTNFVFSSHAATHLCAKTRQSPQERLCSSHDPAVVVADDVMLFRGPAEGGFPFLPQQEQVPMKVLVTGRAVKRPWLQKGELFLDQDDFLAFSHRLNLMTYQALEDFGPSGAFAADAPPPPVLVLSACGLSDPEHRQPRGGIAQALKTWRTMWSGYFQAVVVACGDRETAAIIDRVVNTDVYMKVLQNQALSPSAKEWHWKLELMQLSYNPVFANIARRMASIREAPVVSHSGSLRPDRRQSGGRRSSGAGIMFLTEAMSENQRPAGAVLQTAASRLSLVDPSEPGESLSIASLSRSMMIGKSLTSAASHLGDPESREQSFMTRNGSMLMTSASTTGGGRPSARRASLAVGKDGQPEDSRAQMERIAKLRMEQTDHEQQLKDEEDKRNQAKMAEILVKAWGVGGKRMSGIVSKVEKKDDKDKKKLHGRLGNKEAEREAQEEKKAKLETMTLDKKRQIDQAAAVLGCPVDLRNYIFKQIEKEIKQNANAAKEQDEEDALEDLESPDINASLFKDGPSPGTEEVSAVFEEVRLLAESIEKLLEPRWKDLHGGSYSARTPRKTPGGGTLPAIRQGA